MIVFLVGYMGCGKTTIGRRLARRLGYDFADTDDRIEKQEGADVCDIFLPVRSISARRSAGCSNS